jgi:hypothetical protein
VADTESISIRQERVIASGRQGKPSNGQNRLQKCVREMESDLSHRDAEVRRCALEKLVSLHLPAAEPTDNHNLHTHTFFSYHAAGWSPSRFAWEAAKANLYAAGIIDFDVMDGVVEFLDAAELLTLRASAGIEVRAYLAPFSKDVIDSPGEPGVHYIAGAGVVSPPAPGTPQAAYLDSLRQGAAARNRALVARINAKVPDIALDYDADVVSMSAGGCPTERHIVRAYLAKSSKVFENPDAWLAFWAGLLGMTTEAFAPVSRNVPQLEEKVRAKLAKRGGLGYVQPDETTFPPVRSVFDWVKSIGGIPLDSWLDGTSEGEAKARELFECNREQGALGLNLIPDRNWNISDPEQKKLKLRNLETVLNLAREHHAPLHIGTEGNRDGMPFVDDLAIPELAPYKRDFMAGARLFVGHGLLARFAQFPYAGAAADAEFGARIKEKNRFFESVGELPAVDARYAWYLRQVGPEKALEAIRLSVRRGVWTTAPIR